MKKLLNTLYVTSEGAWLRKDGANVVVEIEGAERGRAPLHLLGAIVCFGQVGLSPHLMHAASETGISITFLGWTGRFLARVEGPQSGNVLLRRAQHSRTADAPVTVARTIVAAKIANQRGVIRRAIRDHGDPEHILDGVERRLNRSARVALDSDDLDALRGIEGDAESAGEDKDERMAVGKLGIGGGWDDYLLYNTTCRRTTPTRQAHSGVRRLVRSSGRFGAWEGA